MADPKYGSVQQVFEAASKEIAEQLEGLKKKIDGVAEERGQIMEVKPLLNRYGMFSGKGVFKEPDCLPSKLNTDAFYNAAHYCHDTYRMDAIRKTREYVESSHANAVDYCERLLAVLAERHAENEVALANNAKAYAHICSFMTSYGFHNTESETELVRGKSKTIERTAGWVLSLKRTIKLSDDYDSLCQNVRTWLVDYGRWKNKRLAEIAVEERKAKEEQQKTKDYAEAIIYARANGLDENSETLVSDVDEHKEQAWREANYPDGTEMSHKCCDTCSIWTIGERRCSCGNRRMSLCVEKMQDGEFYAYAEAY